MHISGRVVGSGSMPVAGIEVRSLRTGARDTTNHAGAYELHASRTATHGGRTDTLVFARQGQFLARVDVTRRAGELPDTRVIQRDIAGYLAVGDDPVHRIELVMRGDGIDPASPAVTEAYYNAVAGNYSGYAFFPASVAVMNFEVRVDVYDADGVLLGSSQIVPFNSYAGDITIPAFSVEPEPDR